MGSGKATGGLVGEETTHAVSEHAEDTVVVGAGNLFSECGGDLSGVGEGRLAAQGFPAWQLDRVQLHGGREERRPVA